MIALLRTEMYKAIRRLRTYIIFGVAIALPVIITVAQKVSEPRRERGGAENEIFSLATHSGIVLPAVVLAMMSGFLLLVIAAIFAGDALAGEAAWGNLRYVLVRPIGRGRLLVSKLAVSAVLAWAVTLVVSATGLAAGVIFFGWRPLDLLIGVHQSTTTLLWHLGLATGYVAWSLVSILSFGLLFSALTDTPAGAIAAAAGLAIVSQILDAISALGSIRNVLPTHYLTAWQTLYTRDEVSSDMAVGALLQLGYLVVFAGLAWWWFRRKDILS
jgi:ABC-2 type transport system permease protein